MDVNELKVIHAVFGRGRNDVRTNAVYQYDVGRVLVFDGLKLPTSYQVHMSNSPTATAYTVLGDANGAPIPDELLKSGLPIHAYVYVSDENSGVTVRHAFIPVTAKPQPADLDIEPAEMTVIDQAVSALNTANDLMRESLDTVDTKIQNALTEAKDSGEFDGPQGEKGDKGDKGDTGPVGPQGEQGIQGEKGDTGDIGPVGPQGEKGEKGDTGDMGPVGPQGPKGDKGDTGEQGIQGVQGIQGIQGPKGDTGDVGPVGPRGEKGDKGDTYVLTEFDKKDISDLAFADLEAQKGSPNGIATLDDGGRVPAAQLPSFVDDVVEYRNAEQFPLQGETGKIYVDTDANKVYRWSGSQYTEISESLALGDTAETAFAGNRGKAVEDAVAALSTGKADKSEIPEVPVQDVQVNGTSVLQNGIANVPIGSDRNVGVLKPRGGVYGIASSSDGSFWVNKAADNEIKSADGDYKPIVTGNQHRSTFYGLAKAAGDTTQSVSDNPVGTYTAEAKTAIQNMLDVPSKADIPEVPVQDVQVNGTSVLDANGVANVPIATSLQAGVVRGVDTFGISIGNGGIMIVNPSSNDEIKIGSNNFKPIVPSKQSQSTFYGLAKAAGHDEKDSTKPLGTYTPEAKGAIQKMLGVSDLIAPEENNLIASKPYAIGDLFTANGKLYKATAAIAQDAAIILPDGVGANCEEITVADGFVKKTDYATNNEAGVVKVANGTGIGLNELNQLSISAARKSEIQAGTNTTKPLVSASTGTVSFYGLAKAAGDTTQSQSSNAVGTYTSEAKTAIQNMLDVPNKAAVTTIETKVDSFVDNAVIVSPTQPTAEDNKIWVNEDASYVEVPTMAEFNALDASAVKDVQVNGTSVVQNGVANVPRAASSVFGVSKINRELGIEISNNGELRTYFAETAQIKPGTNYYRPITPYTQHTSAFYGLAKAAGDTTQSTSSNAVGTYTDEAKASIQTMLGIGNNGMIVSRLSGTDPVISMQPNCRYICGEVSSISITAPAVGISNVRFISGTSVSVLTSTDIIWPEWFDPTALDTSTVYEITVSDGYGSIATWPAS